MITEPNIDKSKLKQTLETEYGLKIINLIFVPKGEVSWGYIVENENGNKYFLKIHQVKNLAPERFQLLYDLHNKADINNIIYPQSTIDGKLEISINGYPSVLFNFVESKNAHEISLSNEQYEKVGELLGNIHQSFKVIGNYPVKEKFVIPHRDEFNAVMKKLKERSVYQNPIKQDAYDLFSSHKEKLYEEMKSLEKLSNSIQKENINFVLCHGEPTPGNIMITPDGEVFLIDWDEPIMAPKEKDLLFFSNHLDAFLNGYSKYSSDLDINEEIKSFYNHLWNVSEITDLGRRLFFNEISKEELQHALDEFKDFLGYSGLDKQL